MMKCACGFVAESKRSTTGRALMNAHRRTCPAFWRSVHDEMARISVMLYGKPLAISMSEWNRYRNHEYPSWEGMRDWGKLWSDVQLESGLGPSSRGRGSMKIKGAIADDSALWRRMDEIAMTEVAAGETEAYATLTYRTGLPICEDTYRRTGRMVLR